MVSINPSHVRLLELYGYYQTEILNDDEGLKLLEKVDYIGKTSVGNNGAGKYNDASSTSCILMISGNYNNMGIISNVNKEITRLTQYNKTDLIGNNVTRI